MIRNVVLSSYVSYPIDIPSHYPFAQKMRRFNAYKVRIKGATLLVFETGRMILTGLNKLKDARNLVKEFCAKLGVKLVYCKVVNITGSLSLPFKINYNRLL